MYVADGRGLATVTAGGNGTPRTFEWQKHSMFLLPHSHTVQLTNTQGDRPVRLLHQNYLPLAMLTLADPSFFFNNPHEDPGRLSGGDGEFYSEAKAQRISMDPNRATGFQEIWVGNFFPDMRAWDKLVPYWGRGAGGHVVSVKFPGSENWAHMSVFPARSYKKGHRHGPGVVIIIPAGEGYSVMWPEGAEKIVVPWHEGSVFRPAEQVVPPALQRRLHGWQVPGPALTPAHQHGGRRRWTLRATRSSTPTRIPGFARSSRTSLRSVGSPAVCPTRHTGTPGSSGPITRRSRRARVPCTPS